MKAVVKDLSKCELSVDVVLEDGRRLADLLVSSGLAQRCTRPLTGSLVYSTPKSSATDSVSSPLTHGQKPDDSAHSLSTPSSGASHNHSNIKVGIISVLLFISHFIFFTNTITRMHTHTQTNTQTNKYIVLISYFTLLFQSISPARNLSTSKKR